ncbi:endonuclease MutS2 [Candidatus Galacturonibacter soehngenii]|uniref:DNA mismatch repair protein MutS n=1 Tax=Candidatus Galacturonatibacter soehngenii TaxID=2307010 RepID=A0A7V7UBW0_9FIRM|nr:DNA mismatch repair protein MutS [Candidatus Galacturonibacter soehngenii]KAB1438320.1 DNA mismatch repair protein MutS [Candidatus Galacturonibacter soehngenii]
MNQSFKILEFDKIKEHLVASALTERAKQQLNELQPFLSEQELEKNKSETTQARIILDHYGEPPLVSLNQVESILITAKQGGLLTPAQLEYVGTVLVSVLRLKDYLNRAKSLEVSLAYYEEQLGSIDELRKEISEKIRGERVDDYASKQLKTLRSEIDALDSKMRTTADSMLRKNKECFTDHFVTLRNGRICLPVKKEYKFKISGSTIDKSSTGATLFIEPTKISQMNEELSYLKIEEENEERRILYSLAAKVTESEDIFYENIRIIEKLDFIFAKGKLSLDMKATEPRINTQRKIEIRNGRHPFLDESKCIPLNFEIGEGINGIVVTGPNTGGKTVAIKTVGLLSIMAQSGLHVPCEYGNFTMNSQYLCDIGDGQNITENLSTFSAHIKNILFILQRVNKESLVIVDELGSGTDPAEGMGIAVAILEELRKSGCLFLATTHYPEIKTYAANTSGVINARMAFDKDSLQPLYQLKVGEAGESCALQIAKSLGMPIDMLITASKAAYKEEENAFIKSLIQEKKKDVPKQEPIPKIQKKKEKVITKELSTLYNIGDSVTIYPDKKIGIVCKRVNEKGVLQVQLKDKKIWLNHKRVKLLVKAEELYPEDYDFSIVFDSVEKRKAQHQMGRKYAGDFEITFDE